MTDKEVWEKLWEAKCSFTVPEVFAQAETTQDVQMSAWNGNHPVEKNCEEYTVKAGETVLITVVSRFGDVGVRGRNIHSPTHGYHARVSPDILVNLRIL